MKNQKLLILLAAAITVFALATAPVMADLAADVTIDYNANDPASGIDGSSWAPLVTGPDYNHTFTFGADVTLETISSAGTSLAKAYRFTGVTGSDQMPDWAAMDENQDATWELWIKPADTGDADQVIFDTGGSGDGMAIWYTVGTAGDNTGTIKFTIDDGSVQSTVSAEIDTSDFSHIVMTYDRDSDGGDVDLMQMYVDGELVADNTDTNPTNLHDWSGTDDGRLGNYNGSTGDTIPQGQFEGDISIFRFWELKALTSVEAAGNYALYGTDPMDPSPADDPAGLDPESLDPLTLEWTNLDPNTNDAAVTYVDVWFGTDPCTLGETTWKKHVVAVNQSTLLVTPPAADQYFWLVNSYLNGHPDDVTYGTGPGEPNMIEGKLYTFFAEVDPAPKVTINTLPQATWSGNGTVLDATITDKGDSDVLIDWAVDASPPVDVTFKDDITDTATPTITITTSSYPNAMIVNPGFEDPVMDDGAYPWVHPGWGNSGSGGRSIFNPGLEGTDYPAYGGEAPEGENVIFVNEGDSAAQVLNETLAADTTYTLTVKVGRNAYYPGAGYKVELLAGGTPGDTGSIVDGDVIGDDPNTQELITGDFITSTVTVLPEDIDPALLGKPIQIRLYSIGPDETETNFDDVKLTANPPFPAPKVQTVTVTVLVSDGATEAPVEASVEVDVYDSACSMARIGYGKDNIADLDKSCIVEIGDLKLIAMQWLNDDKQLDNYAISVHQPEEGIVFNGTFHMYKPGTLYTVRGSTPDGTADGDIWVQTIGDNRPLSSTIPIEFEDGTSGMEIDCPGWITPVETHVAATNAADLYSRGFAPEDGSSVLNAFGAWSGQNGTLAKTPPLNLPIRGANGVYTLSAMVHGNPEPKTFELLVDGEVITPDSTVEPTDSGQYQLISRTYNSIPEGEVVIFVGTRRPEEGVDPPLTGSRMRIDNITLEVEILDTDLADVDAGDAIVTWSGEPATMDPNIVDNDTQSRVMSYLWTTEDAGVEFANPVNAGDPNTTTDEIPTVTITNDGPSRRVMLTLTVTQGNADPISDSVLVYVYENPCKAAIAEDMQFEFDITDINGDCITNLKDVADVAAGWLINYKETAQKDRLEE